VPVTVNQASRAGAAPEAPESVAISVDAAEPTVIDELGDGKPVIPTEINLLPLREVVIVPVLVAPLGVEKVKVK